MPYNVTIINVREHTGYFVYKTLQFWVFCETENNLESFEFCSYGAKLFTRSLNVLENAPLKVMYTFVTNHSISMISIKLLLNNK